jgi:DNA/RNA endonuclease YhcR with UshA esterase domain
MRRGYFAVWLALWIFGLTGAAQAQDLQVILDSEAAQYLGKNVEVHGVVSGVHTSRRANSFIDIGGHYPNQSFTGFIPAGSEISGDKQFLQSILGKEIGIRGLVTLYKGKPEIEVTERSQIVER